MDCVLDESWSVLLMSDVQCLRHRSFYDKSWLVNTRRSITGAI